MSQTYYAILTALGEAKLANAAALNQPLQISKMAVGDGNGSLPNPDRTQTALVRETYRANLNTLQVDPANASQIIAELVIPETVGGWWIRELGLYDAAGALVAVANCPPSYKPQLAEGSGRTQVLRMVLVVSSTSAVELKIDPSVVLATREFVTTTVASAMAKLDGKDSVRAATTSNLAALSGLLTVDDVALVAGDRVLVKNQATASQNGIYVVAAGVWSRAADADSSIEVTPGLLVAVESGSVNGDSLWQLTTDAPIVLGTTALTFEVAAGPVGIAAGTYRSVTIDKRGRVIGATNPTTLQGYGITDAASLAQLSGVPRGLVASANGLSAQINIAAQELTVSNASGEGQRLHNLVLSISLAAAGAGGLDTGAVTASSWYSLWVIFNATTSAISAIAALCPVVTGATTAGSAVVTGLASTSSMRPGMTFAGGTFPAGTVIKTVDGPNQITASLPAGATAAGVSLRFVYDPVMPNGYTHKTRVGMTFTDATANKFPLRFNQMGRKVDYAPLSGTNLAVAPILASGHTSSSSVQIGTGNFIPPTASRMKVSIYALAPSQSGNYVGVSSRSTSDILQHEIWIGGFAGAYLATAGEIDTTNGLFWLAGANTSGTIKCIGWEDNL